MRDGDYDFLLNRLWRRREAEPANRDIRQIDRRLLLQPRHSSTFSAAIRRPRRTSSAKRWRSIRRTRCSSASRPSPNVYSQRNEDLLFEIFVRNLPAR